MKGFGGKRPENVHQNKFLVQFSIAKSAILTARNKSLATTYVVEPSQSISLRVGSDVAFKIDVVSLFDISWV